MDSGNTPCQVSSASGSLYKDRRQGKPVSRLTSRRVSIPCETTLPKPDQVVNSVDFVYHNGTVVREADVCKGYFMIPAGTGEQSMAPEGSGCP